MTKNGLGLVIIFERMVLLESRQGKTRFNKIAYDSYGCFDNKI